MRGLRELLVVIMNATMIEKLFQEDIDDVAASQKFYVELRTEQCHGACPRLAARLRHPSSLDLRL